MQWGYANNTTGGGGYNEGDEDWQTITFPISFPNKCMAFIPVSGVPNHNFGDNVSYTTATKSIYPNKNGVSYYVNGTFSMWYAIGY